MCPNNCQRTVPVTIDLGDGMGPALQCLDCDRLLPLEGDGDWEPEGWNDE